MRRHRVAIVSDFFFPGFGGVEVHIYNLAQCLMRRGHKVVIITRAYGDRVGIRYYTNGMKVYYLPLRAAKLPPGSVTLPTFLTVFPLLRTIYIRERITVVHGHQTTSNLCHEALFHAGTMGLKTCFTDHSLFGFADMASININKVLQWSMCTVDQVICVSNTSRENTVLRSKIPPELVSVIPNATDTSAFTPPEDMKYKSWTSKIDKEGLTIIVITRLVYRKGSDLFVDVIQEICKRHPDIKWIIGGDGPRRSQIEQMIEHNDLLDRVKILGALQHTEVRSVLNQGQIFLNCSLTEAFCIALIEAASCGLLGVSTRVGGVPEVLPPNMLLLADPDPQSIIAALEEAIARVPFLSPWEMHENVRRFYSWDWVSERTERVYDRILDTPTLSLYERLHNYSMVGPLFGIICWLLCVADWILLKILVYLVPEATIDIAPDFPTVFYSQNKAVLNGSEGSMPQSVAERLPSNPRLFPKDRVPRFIFKAKNGHFHFVMEEPSVTSNFLWYMSSPALVSLQQLEEEMRKSDRRWFATDRRGYELQVKTGASTTEGVPYVCLRSLDKDDEYWFGPRHAESPAEKATLVVTVAELYLKSQLHQKRLIRLLINGIRRVVKNSQVFRNGRTMIEVRKDKPSSELLQLLSLVPGIAKIYEAVPVERGGDPRGKFLMNGAGGIPILPDQRVLALISGGIDSPVAAYCMMTRGCHVNGVHFLNSTNDTAAVMEKCRKISEKLSLIQGRFHMYYVDISKLQSQIVANIPNNNRTLIYKWFMLSISACFDDSSFIVTGDSAGQVASQTVANLSTLYPTIDKAIVSPLIGMPKVDIMEKARRIDTYDFSIREGADCCQYMMCKTGANLCIGRRSLAACVRKVQLVELNVIQEIYHDGKLCESFNHTFLPKVGLRTPKDVKEPTHEGTHKEEEEVINFDAAAGTTMHESVRQAFLSAPEGNANSMHVSGREARMAIEKARGELAKALGVPANDIIFTSGGTESNNIALHGYHVVRDAWSHASTAQPPGTADDAPIVRVVDLVNHETGSINCDLKRPVGGRLHIDASQALTKIDFSTLDLSEADSITVTAHKINGPVGVGAVYLRNLECQRLYSGGSQEKGIRPGTENTPAIVGFAKALQLDRTQSVHREIEAFVVDELIEMGCDINRRGDTSGFIVHTTLPVGYDNTEVVARLSTKYHVEVGTGSACKSSEVNTSVYETLGKAPAPTRSLRLSWDSYATMHQAELVVDALRNVLSELKPRL